MKRLKLCNLCNHEQALHLIESDQVYCAQLDCKCKGETMTQINVSNQELIQKSKDIHGELYHKINSLQRDLNISLANNERLKKRLDDEENRPTTPPVDFWYGERKEYVLEGKQYSLPFTIYEHIKDLESRSFSESEHSEIIKSFKQAINILEQ